MKNNIKKSAPIFSNKRQAQDKEIVLKSIIKNIEKGTNKKLSELRTELKEEDIFRISLKYVTTTKKALCSALNIPVESGCRYKRSLEKNGLLVQSVDEVICPYTKHMAHLISTNPKEFNKLLKSKSNQTKLFE
ncbi:hypothetical protein ACG2LH_15805 [Zhouia sp. PK063]|uniref:hypothetical protein n=1 Tax=Zhouia sp. PK063 TaxID=3373602 RepID=UPI0037A23658